MKYCIDRCLITDLHGQKDPRHVVSIAMELEESVQGPLGFYNRILKAFDPAFDLYGVRFDDRNMIFILSIPASGDFAVRFGDFLSDQSKTACPETLAAFIERFVRDNIAAPGSEPPAIDRFHVIVSVYKGKSIPLNGGLSLLHCLAMSAVAEQLNIARSGFRAKSLRGSPIFKAYIISLARPILPYYILHRVVNTMYTRHADDLTPAYAKAIFQSSTLFNQFPPSWAPSPARVSRRDVKYSRYLLVFTRTEGSEEAGAYSTRGTTCGMEWTKHDRLPLIVYSTVGRYLLVALESSEKQDMITSLASPCVDIPGMTHVIQYPIVTDGEFWTVCRAVAEAALAAGGEPVTVVKRSKDEAPVREFITDLSRQIKHRRVHFDKLQVPDIRPRVEFLFKHKDDKGVCEGWCRAMFQGLRQTSHFGPDSAGVAQYQIKSEMDGEPPPSAGF